MFQRQQRIPQIILLLKRRVVHKATQVFSSRNFFELSVCFSIKRKPKLLKTVTVLVKIMEAFKLIKQGAEAKIYEGFYLGKPTIIKERFVKSYRHKYLDDSLTKERMRAEAKALVRCKTVGIATPMILCVNFNTRMIFMENFIHSIPLKDYIEQTSLDTLLELSITIGETLGKMHAGSIIHGDLTTSNILLVNTRNKDCFADLNELKLVLIDFGLAHIHCSSEDKGVDLYVLERAMLSTHAVADKMFPRILEGYKQSYKSGFKEVLLKYEEVRARGRKRTMVG